MNPLTDELNEVRTNNQQEANLLMQEIKNLENGNQTSEDTIQKVNNVSNRTTEILNYLLSNYDNQIVPTIKESITHAKKNISDATDILQQAEKDLPTIQKLLNDTSKGIGIGKTKISTIKNELPAIEGNIKEMANRIRDFESKENIYEIVNLLKNDVKKESDFLKEPVLLKKNKLYHIPNYGSAMSPFFTTLSLWVGAMLLISILSVDVKDDLNPKSVQVLFGHLLTFILIALLQSLIVTIGDIYLLRAYVVEKQWFILFGLLNSAIFMIMVYTLVSVFGNVGKCLGIIFLVLQISGSGGTFPIQVTPTFFQKINPFLPFTYSISLMRESVGGILWDVIQKDIMILTIYALLSLLIGVLLKKRLNALSTGLVERAKNSKLLQ
jgi:putative membrane protein